jgi:hypothetical protein
MHETILGLNTNAALFSVKVFYYYFFFLGGGEGGGECGSKSVHLRAAKTLYFKALNEIKL